jgi:hypothetical protein
LFDTEKPKSEMAVRRMLAAVTPLVPSFFVKRAVKRLDIIVPPEMIIDIMPIYDIGMSNPECIAGHAAPSSESGRPRLIKAKYIIAKSKRYIFFSEICTWNIIPRPN